MSRRGTNKDCPCTGQLHCGSSEQKYNPVKNKECSCTKEAHNDSATSGCKTKECSCTEDKDQATGPAAKTKECPLEKHDNACDSSACVCNVEDVSEVGVKTSDSDEVCGCESASSLQRGSQGFISIRYDDQEEVTFNLIDETGSCVQLGALTSSSDEDVCYRASGCCHSSCHDAYHKLPQSRQPPWCLDWLLNSGSCPEEPSRCPRAQSQSTLKIQPEDCPCKVESKVATKTTSTQETQTETKTEPKNTETKTEFKNTEVQTEEKKKCCRPKPAVKEEEKKTPSPAKEDEKRSSSPAKEGKEGSPTPPKEGKKKSSPPVKAGKKKKSPPRTKAGSKRARAMSRAKLNPKPNVKKARFDPSINVKDSGKDARPDKDDPPVVQVSWTYGHSGNVIPSAYPVVDGWNYGAAHAAYDQEKPARESYLDYGWSGTSSRADPLEDWWRYGHASDMKPRRAVKIDKSGPYCIVVGDTANEIPMKTLHSPIESFIYCTDMQWKSNRVAESSSVLIQTETPESVDEIVEREEPLAVADCPSERAMVDKATVFPETPEEAAEVTPVQPTPSEATPVHDVTPSQPVTSVPVASTASQPVASPTSQHVASPTWQPVVPAPWQLQHLPCGCALHPRVDVCACARTASHVTYRRERDDCDTWKNIVLFLSFLLIVYLLRAYWCMQDHNYIYYRHI